MAWIEFRTPQRRSVARANGQCACLIKRPHLQAHLWPSCADQFLGRVLIEGVDEPKSARRGLPPSGFPGSSGCPGRGIRRLRAAARFACADRPGAGAMSTFGGKANMANRVEIFYVRQNAGDANDIDQSGKMLSLGDRFVPHIVPRDGFYCEESWSEWQDLRLSLSDIEIFEVFVRSF